MLSGFHLSQENRSAGFREKLWFKRISEGDRGGHLTSSTSLCTQTSISHACTHMNIYIVFLSKKEVNLKLKISICQNPHQLYIYSYESQLPKEFRWGKQYASPFLNHGLSPLRLLGPIPTTTCQGGKWKINVLSAQLQGKILLLLFLSSDRDPDNPEW